MARQGGSAREAGEGETKGIHVASSFVSIHHSYDAIAGKVRARAGNFDQSGSRCMMPRRFVACSREPRAIRSVFAVWQGESVPLALHPAENLMKPRLILASASPRRRTLLEEAGYLLEVDPSGFEEPDPQPERSPADYAAELAWRKAAAVARRRKTGLILGADTVCEVGGRILNKPLDRADAKRMIGLQEGHDTDVISGICLFRAESPEWVARSKSASCEFRRLSDHERNQYLDSNRWEGKSGAYGVQDHDPFVEVVHGSFSNVVGLPMERLAQLLQNLSGCLIRIDRGMELAISALPNPQVSATGVSERSRANGTISLRRPRTGSSWPGCSSCRWPPPSWRARARPGRISPDLPPSWRPTPACSTPLPRSTASARTNISKDLRDRPAHGRLRSQHPPARDGRRTFQEDGGRKSASNRSRPRTPRPASGCNWPTWSARGTPSGPSGS